MPNEEHEAPKQQEPDDKDLVISSLTQQLAAKAQEVADRERHIYRLNQQVQQQGEIIDDLTAKVPKEKTK